MDKKVNEKKKKYAIVITFLVLMICITGGTYAYFALTASNNSVTGSVGGASLNLTVTKVYPTSEHSSKNMIPQLESTLDEAISLDHKCVDDNGNVICQVYSATVTNVGSTTSVLNGTISFTGIENMPNLKWMRINDSNTLGTYSSSLASTDKALFEEERSFGANTSNTYYFVFWIDETGEVQTDSGTFRANIEFDSSTGGLTSTIVPGGVVAKLLIDNPVKESLTNMFNYNSEGEDSSGTVNSDYITNGIYMMEDDDGPSYYFRGNVDNLIQFGEYNSDYYEVSGAKYVYDDGMGSVNEYTYDSLETCIGEWGYNCIEVKQLKYAAGTPLYWRIIRINGDGTLRLLYSGTSKDASGEDLTIGESLYNGEYDDSSSFNDKKYVGYTYDNGVNSIIKEKVDTWFVTIFDEGDYEQYIISGKYCNDTSGYSADGDNGYFSAGFRTTSPRLTCPVTVENFGGSYNLKVGLITMDELVLGGASYIDSYNYLYSSVNYWTMTPDTFMELNFPQVFNYNQRLIDYYDGNVNLKYGVRPVINVDPTSLKISGKGSSVEPYVLIPQ